MPAFPSLHPQTISQCVTRAASAWRAPELSVPSPSMDMDSSICWRALEHPLSPLPPWTHSNSSICLESLGASSVPSPSYVQTPAMRKTARNPQIPHEKNHNMGKNCCRFLQEQGPCPVCSYYKYPLIFPAPSPGAFVESCSGYNSENTLTLLLLTLE